MKRKTDEEKEREREMKINREREREMKRKREIQRHNERMTGEHCLKGKAQYSLPPHKDILV